jgi:hypothetical protein
MSVIILDNLPFNVPIETLLEKMKAKEKPRACEQLAKILEEAEKVGRPKAMYKATYVDEKGDDFVISEGVRFTSRVLRVNLDAVHRIFPYIVTCGTELAQWADSFSGYYERYSADVICELALRGARNHFNDYLAKVHHTGKTSVMNPGSLTDWPLEQQKQLFSLLGDPNSIGVQLTETCLMTPVKTISGIRFPMETNYNNCMLCPRNECPSRQAPYEEELKEKYK